MALLVVETLVLPSSIADDAVAGLQERDPESLLSPLIQTLQRRQVLPQHALFVVSRTGLKRATCLWHTVMETCRMHRIAFDCLQVPDSSYVSLAKNTDQVMRDTSWQQRLAEIWRARLPGAAAAPQVGLQSGLDHCCSVMVLPAGAAVHPHCQCQGTWLCSVQAKGGTPQSRLAFPQLHSQNTTRGAAVPSLADTLKWLRRCAREQPSRHIQVCLRAVLLAHECLLLQ